jgi:hypothetical protein
VVNRTGIRESQHEITGDVVDHVPFPIEGSDGAVPEQFTVLPESIKDQVDTEFIERLR